MNTKKETALRPRTGRRLSFSKGKKAAKHDLKASDEELEAAPASSPADLESPRGSPPETKKSSTVGGFLKDSLKKSKHALQKADRPLSSLLKRPASRSGSRERRGSKDVKGTSGSGLPDDVNQGWGAPQEDSKSSREESDKQISTKPAASSSGGVGNSASGTLGRHSRSGSVESEDAVELPSPAKSANLQRPTTAAPKKIGGWGQGDITERPSTAAGKRRGSTALKNRGIVRPPTSAGRPGADGLIDLTETRPESPVVQELPYIEDITTSDFGSEVAKAPSMALNAMTAYKNLEDSRLMKQSAFGTLDTDIDLSLLLNKLSLDNETRDEPTAWTWDYLFTCVAGDMKRATLDPESDEGLPEQENSLEGAAVAAN